MSEPTGLAKFPILEEIELVNNIANGEHLLRPVCDRFALAPIIVAELVSFASSLCNFDVFVHRFFQSKRFEVEVSVCVQFERVLAT